MLLISANLIIYICRLMCKLYRNCGGIQGEGRKFKDFRVGRSFEKGKQEKWEKARKPNICSAKQGKEAKITMQRHLRSAAGLLNHCCGSGPIFTGSRSGSGLLEKLDPDPIQAYFGFRLHARYNDNIQKDTYI